MKHVLLTTVAFLGCVGQSAVAEPEALPADLKSVIAQVRDAATHMDFAALRRNMIEEFIWSFGGDGSAEQALTEWRRDAKYLKALAAATNAECSLSGTDYVQCPVDAGLSFRAGFKHVGAQWKMVSFVEGD